MAKSSKMHQLLAVEADLRAAFNKILQESMVTFTKKTDHFDGHVKTHKYLAAADEGVKSRVQDEHKAIVTTVQQKLDY